MTTDVLEQLRAIPDARERARAAGQFVSEQTEAEYKARDLRDAAAFAYLDRADDPNRYGFNKETYTAAGMTHMTWHRIRQLWEIKHRVREAPAGRRRRTLRQLPKIDRKLTQDQLIEVMREQHALSEVIHDTWIAAANIRADAIVELLDEEPSNRILAAVALVDEHTVYQIRRTERERRIEAAAQAERDKRKARRDARKAAEAAAG